MRSPSAGDSRSPVSASPSERRSIQSRPSGLSITRSEEHTSELQSLMRISYAVFCLKKKNNKHSTITQATHTTKRNHIHKYNRHHHHQSTDDEIDLIN